MKRLNFTLLTLSILIFCSCNTKVDLYSDKGESTIIYSLLDTSADTNYVKVTKSFVGDATVLAQNYDACNYQIGEIDVNLLKEKKVNGVVSYDTIKMYPIQKWLPYDSTSTFYNGCYQTYYYTAQKLATGQKYRVSVKRNDGTVVYGETTTVDNFMIIAPLENAKINYDSEATYQVKWQNKGENIKTNAAYFELVAYFRYWELQPGATEKVEKEIKWVINSGTADKLFSSNDGWYFISYKPQGLFSIIKNNEYLKNNSPYGVQRGIKKIRYEVAAIGDELYNYLIINNSSSAVQDTPEYSNVENGVGLVSARVTNKRFVIPNELTRQKITNDFPDYGFIYDPNNPTD